MTTLHMKSTRLKCMPTDENCRSLYPAVCSKAPKTSSLHNKSAVTKINTQIQADTRSVLADVGNRKLRTARHMAPTVSSQLKASTRTVKESTGNREAKQSQFNNKEKLACSGVDASSTGIKTATSKTQAKKKRDMPPEREEAKGKKSAGVNRRVEMQAVKKVKAQDDMMDVEQDLAQTHGNIESVPLEVALPQDTQCSDEMVIEINLDKLNVEDKVNTAIVNEKVADPIMVEEYAEEIFEYMRELETKFKPDPKYMSRQTEISWQMRRTMVSWLVELHAYLRMYPETLHLCVHLIDRFLSIKVVAKQKLQLVGLVALYIASKIEEPRYPSISELGFYCNYAYTEDEFLKAERYLLNQLNFTGLNWPGPYSFLRRLSGVDGFHTTVRTIAKYLLEVALLQEEFLHLPPSHITAASYKLALASMGMKWTPAHEEHGGYSGEEVQGVVDLFTRCLRKKDKQKETATVFEKYSDDHYEQVSLLVADYIKNSL
ncbi:uncharacterized protein VTP21DRAFT_7702 [Calcarisporiella thermophila]|uniref:uncharacterized protein n=1 Tax=Calcarisporiella thermophila TaxID=911321 RepID=UPI0037447DFD